MSQEHTESSMEMEMEMEKEKEKEAMNNMIMKVGPWGGTGGSEWDTKGSVGVKEIIVRYGAVVDSFMVQTVCSNGEFQWSSKFGGQGGDKMGKVTLNWPDEVITCIEGYYGACWFGCPVVVRSLKIVTNRATHGPFGWEMGTHFSLPFSGATIVGLHGHFDQFLYSIGAFMKPLTSEGSVPCQQANDMVVIKSPTQQLPLWGGIGGQPWDDGVFSGVKSIVVKREDDAIHSITVEYDRNGKSIFSLRHGGPGGEILNRIRFRYPKEYLVCVSGYYGSIEGSSGFEVIKSLTFYTNKGKYGPLGREIGKFFSSSLQAITGGQIVGIMGRSGTYLDALGVHTEYF